MKERKILFSAPMVRAILDDAKTKTRRVVKYAITGPNPPHGIFDWHNAKGEWLAAHGGAFAFEKTNAALLCPYGQPGDRLWVRESWQYYDWTEDGEPCIRFAADNATTWPEVSEDWSDRVVDVWEVLSRDSNYNIDNYARDRRWRPSIHIPRWASRILLEVTDVRVERLNDISEEDAIAEGVRSTGDGAFHIENDRFRAPDPVECYARLWESINGPGSWDANPWVWCVSFRGVK